MNLSPPLRAFTALNYLIAFTTLEAQSTAPRITEFVSINSNSLTDGDGNTPDWIELHNPNPSPLGIAGYHLTDDPEIPNKYTFPAGTEIPGGAYIVVFASGKPAPGYTDAGGNLHTTFSLSGSGEYLALLAPDNTVIQDFAPAYPAQREDISYGDVSSFPPATVDLVTQNADSTWLVPDADIGDTWNTDPAFDDSSWTAAKTGIGFGYDALVGENGNTNSAMFFINTSVYLRIPFELDDASAVLSLDLKMRYEDGFAAYINGHPVASDNAPETLTHTSSATEERLSGDAVLPVSFPLSPDGGMLNDGTNVLAIHGLNLTTAGAGSGAFLALPGLTAEISDSGDTMSLGYFTEPTPRAANTTTAVAGFVKDTKFSVDRGYYTDPFEVSISTETEGATIYYTTDGTPPSVENGITYTLPITIASTTALRAIATKSGFQPTNIDTQTYLFVDDIVRQSNRPSGYPSTWGGSPADYEMDSEIVDDPDYAGKFDEAFAALPTLSLVFDPDAFFDRQTGIYQNPREEGPAWERPLSAEFFVSDGSEPGFTIDAGVRIQGGSSRSTDTPKHSLSLRFRSQYGTEKLRYPLFANSSGGSTSVSRFDVLQLRPEYNFGWMHRHWYQADYALYGRDQWASDMFNAMGQNGSHGRWVHLFLNGIYWGLYDVHERPDADHMANYFGGEDDDYDTVNSSVATNGDLDAYDEMMDLAYGNIESPDTYAAIQEYLNIDAFIDYMILNAYVGNRDWDGHNWRAARRREPGAGYLFFPWDTEFAASHVGGGVFPTPPDFFTTSLNTNVTGNNGNRRPTGLQMRLARNAEYRLRYADRVRSHMFNGGALAPDRASELWTSRSSEMAAAIVAESARWGDFRRDVLPGRWDSSDFDLYTRDDHYLPVHDWLVGTYIPQRTAIVVEQLRSRNLYTDIDAPDFSMHGGTVPRGFPLLITASESVLFTTDGSDPRLEGGNVNPAATSSDRLTIDESTLVKARARSAGGEWSALTQATFTVAATDIAISEIMYHPAGQPLAEFIELTNTGEFDVSLIGLHFSDGIAFDFDKHSSLQTLAPGARLLVVRDTAAFNSVYGNSFDPVIAGSFQEGTGLSNDGETVTISDADDRIIATVTYNNADPWPVSADGGGRSLVFSGGESYSPINWRPSSADDGNPGTTDSTTYPGGPLLEYALAGPTTIDPTGPTLTYVTSLTADDATVRAEFSPSLSGWQPLVADPLSQVLNSDNTLSITLQLPPGTTGFARLVITLEAD